jgi:hypothetical protein
MYRRVGAFIAFIALGWVIPSAQASTMIGSVDFFKITNNNPGTDISAQLRVDVSDEGSNKVGFSFFNYGGVASSIAEIYFDDVDPALMSTFASKTQGSGVDFSDAAPPSAPGTNLPSGANYSFHATQVAGANGGQGGVPAHGINNASIEHSLTEYLLLVFNLATGVTASDILLSLQADNGFRIGLHVISIANGTTSPGSDSFINATTSVPIPPALLLLGAALAGLGAAQMKRRGHSA